MQEHKILSTSDGTEKQDEPENSMRAPRKAGTGMDACIDSQSFPNDSAPSYSVCSCGEVFVGSPDLEHHAKRYQHTQVYHCALHGCGFSSHRKDNLRSHHQARHGFAPPKETSPKPKKENPRAEKCEPKLGSCVQEESDEMVEVIPRTILDWELKLRTSDDNVAHVSGQPPKAGITFMAKLHRYVVTLVL